MTALAPHPQPDPRERVHVVLVEPGDSRNVGSVARAMQNLGFSHLHLVAPPRYRVEDAAPTACWATDVLERAHLQPTLEQALRPMQQVVGFTARHGRHRPRHILLADWVRQWRLEPPAQTALLFGPEDSGLRQEHLAQCRWLIRIPSAVENPAFNLAQAVLLALYELAQGLEGPALPAHTGPGQPPWQDFYELDRVVRECLLRSRFYHKGTPAQLPDLVKHLLRRMDPDAREMQVLLGMFGKINRALAGRVPVRELPDSSQQDEPPAGAGTGQG